MDRQTFCISHPPLFLVKIARVFMVKEKTARVFHGETNSDVTGKLHFC